MASKREESIKVFVRVRPPIYKEVKLENAVFIRGNQTVAVSTDNKDTSCNYDYVFSELTEQEQVFEKVQPVLVDVLSGINACIFCYGQTSSGKSHTMIGPNGGQDILRAEKSEWGILPRAAEFLLNYLNAKEEEGMLTYEVKASFLQIYNENLYDLLRDSGPMIEDHLIRNEKDKDSELKIREVPKPKSLASTMRDSIPEVYVSGLSEFRVQTGDDVIRMLAYGTSNRMTRSTDFNLTSSRSHAILQLKFEIETQVDSGQTLMSRSKLFLVDLAGSEKIPYISNDNPKHIKELTSINKSLSTLGNVISALATSNRSHIPYRDSKLTRILQDSLGGNTRTILIACVAPTVVHASETLSTLQFADRAKHVRVTVKANTVVDDKITLAKAQAEITRLKALLSHALKQLEEKSSSSGLGNTATTLENLQISEENERLKRENQSLKKLLKSSTALKGIPSSNGRSVSPSSDSSLQKGGYYSDDQAEKKKKAAFMSGVDRFGRPSFDNVGNYLKAAGKMKKLNNIREKEYDSDETDSRRRGKSSAPPSGRGKAPKPLKVNKGEKKTTNSNQESSNSLFKAINDRQVAELNLLLEEANKKLHEQYLSSISNQMKDMFQSKHEIIGLNNNNNQHKPEEMSETVQSAVMKQSTEINPQTTPPPHLEIPQNMAATNTQLPLNLPLQHIQDPNIAMSIMNTYSNYNTNQQPPTPLAQQPLLQPPSSKNSGRVPSHDENEILQLARQQTNALTQESHDAPSNRIILKSKLPPSSSSTPVSNQNDQGRNYRPAMPLPTVLESNTPAAHSANLFANAVHMYNNVNRIANRIQDARHNDGNINAGYPPQQQQWPPQQQQQQQPQQMQFLQQQQQQQAYRQQPSQYPQQQQYQHQYQPQQQPQQYQQYPPQQQQQPQPQQPYPTNPAAVAANSNNNPATYRNPMMQSIPSNQPISNNNPANNNTPTAVNNSKPANLTFTMDDIGRAVELFSFRLNHWERIDLIDFDPNKRQFKCQFPDGGVQWLDLSKKPTRSLADER